MGHIQKIWRKWGWIKKTILFIFLFFLIGFCIPEKFSMPVEGATQKDYRQDSFWYFPWGKSGVHKGVDIFAKAGTNVRASTGGIVYSTGYDDMGGNYIVILGPKWHFHYYAHLKEIQTSGLSWVSRKEIIGTVGNTGNARNRPPHLHYSITSLFPRFWCADGSKQGWKKMYFINPVPYLNNAIK